MGGENEEVDERSRIAMGSWVDVRISQAPIHISCRRYC